MKMIFNDHDKNYSMIDDEFLPEEIEEKKWKWCRTITSTFDISEHIQLYSSDSDKVLLVHDSDAMTTSYEDSEGITGVLSYTVFENIDKFNKFEADVNNQIISKFEAYREAIKQHIIK